MEKNLMFHEHHFVLTVSDISLRQKVQFKPLLNSKTILHLNIMF